MRFDLDKAITVTRRVGAGVGSALAVLEMARAVKDFRAERPEEGFNRLARAGSIAGLVVTVASSIQGAVDGVMVATGSGEVASGDNSVGLEYGTEYELQNARAGVSGKAGTLPLGALAPPEQV